MFEEIPAELPFGAVYFPPFFFTVAIGFACAWLSGKLLNRTGLSQFFWHPALAFLAMWVLFSSLFGMTFLPP